MTGRVRRSWCRRPGSRRRRLPSLARRYASNCSCQLLQCGTHKRPSYASGGTPPQCIAPAGVVVFFRSNPTVIDPPGGHAEGISEPASSACRQMSHHGPAHLVDTEAPIPAHAIGEGCGTACTIEDGHDLVDAAQARGEIERPSFDVHGVANDHAVQSERL